MAAAPTPYASASLYVGDLLGDVTEAILFEIFNAVGPVASVRVCRDADTRRSLGYAYVNYHRVEDAERALDTMNFKGIRNHPCRIMWSHRDPSLRKSGRGNVFVKNLAPSVDNKSLYDTFSVIGNILSCKVSTDANDESLGYGFVHFEGEEAAERAIQDVNGKIIAGQKVQVTAFKSRKERGGNGKNTFTNVYVKNIPEDADDKKLEEMFAKYGQITSCKISSDDAGTSRSFGFVNFASPEGAIAACEALNGFEMGEKKLFVARAQKKEEREKELRERFEQLKLERQKKYAGVNLYVKNLSDQINDERLAEEFSKFGVITSARVMKDPAGKSRGFGFVCFSSPDEASAAVTAMGSYMLDSKPLYVACAQRKEVRRRELEQQYASRKMPAGGMPPVAYPAGPAGPGGMYFPNLHQRNFVYPTQQMIRQWNPSQGAAGTMMGVHPGVGAYQLLPVENRTNRTGGGGGGRGGGRGSRANKGGAPGQQGQGQGNNSNWKYAENVRNQRENQPQQPHQQGAQQQQPRLQQPAVPVEQTNHSEPLTIKALTAAPENTRKQMIGERLFPLVRAKEPTQAGKITGMLLEMDNGELLHLLESPNALKDKVDEAMGVLRFHVTE